MPKNCAKNVSQIKSNKDNWGSLNLTADIPHKLFCQKQFNKKNQRLTRKIPNQVCNDFYSITARGFTLIELLVVVLIIGILAAVALPQYQLAVAKTRATEAVTNLSNIIKAQQMYYMANNKFTNNLTDLDIEIKNTNYVTFICTTPENFSYADCWGKLNKYDLYYDSMVYADHYLFFCAHKKSDSIGEKICKASGSKTSTGSEIYTYYIMD